VALPHRLVGRAARLFWRVTRPRTLGIRALLLDAEGRVALVRHTYADHWYLPGGGVKKGESLEAALRRELDEEIAVTGVAIERVVGLYHNVREGKDDHVVVVAVRTAAAGGDLRRADRLEIAEAGWFAPDALPPGTSPATARRIAEYRDGATALADW
jgi:ADP-ribose pyrophosphatase YjhB (NUDIX family)